MLKKLIINLNIGWVFLTLLSYLSPWIHPGTFWPIAFLGLAFPVLMIINVGFIIAWLLTEWKYAFLSFFVILLGWNNVFYFIGQGSSTIPNEQDLSIASFNTFGFKKLKEQYQYDYPKMAQIVKNKLKPYGQIDILCTQESNSFSSKVLDLALKIPYSHQYSKQGAMVYSRFPILDKGSIRFSNETNSCVWTDIQTPNKVIRVYCVHLQSNRISTDTEDLIDRHELDNKRTWNRIGSILKNYKKFSGYRANEAKEVRDHATKSPYPVILAGDFNDHPLSYTYRMMSEGYNDTFIKKGQGNGKTYKSFIPFLRIDYILADTGFEVGSHQIIDPNLSDHKLILSKLNTH